MTSFLIWLAAFYGAWPGRVMVLLMRADLKMAIPCSVIVMAFTSVVGVLTKLPCTPLQQGVYENWLAASPVVVLGAPMGAAIVA